MISAGDSVTISAGTTLRIRGIDHYANSDEVDTNRAEIIVKGTLIADATGGDPITFEAYDSVPGDSAAWYGIRVLDQGHVVFRNVIIKNAYCGLDLNSETPDEVCSCEFSNNKMYGIYCRNDSTASLETAIRKNTITKDSAASYSGYGIYTRESPSVDSNTVSFYNYGIWAMGDCPTIIYNTIHCAGMGIHARSTDGAVVWCNKFTGQFSRAIDYWHADVNTQANAICPDTINGNDNCGYGLYFGPWGDGEVWFNRFFNCHASGAAVLGSYPNFGDDEDVGGNWFRIPDTSAKALTSSTGIYAERCLWELGDSILDSAIYIDPWVDGSVDFEPFLRVPPQSGEPLPPYEPPPDAKRSVAKEENSQLPRSYALDQNYPNPFNPVTVISYALPEESEVRLTIYNVLGQRVVELVNEMQSPGYYRVTWDGKDESGGSCASGVYLYTIKAGDFAQSRKMMLLK